ncbi:MAG: hypothetical protein H0U66_11095 [Gemmatimonadaceae bacterium]|nr:hypothetical protein [Gemmatimonadaceae bacterium]
MKKNTAQRAEAVPAMAEVASPRLGGLWSALVYATATLWLGAPALLGKFLINIRSDQYLAGYAFREFGAHALRTTGSFPMWNPYIFGGLPYVAAMHGDIFYPTFLLRMIMPTDVAMTVGFMLHIFLAGVFTYYFLRACGFGFYSALAGGLAYMMGGPIASYVSPGHDGKLFVSALTPLALWMLIRGIRDGRYRAFGVFALVTGLAVLSPHPQLLQYMLLLSGAFALYLAFSPGDSGIALPRNTAFARLGLSAASVAVGMVMGAVQYLPVMQYVAWSPRAGGASYEFATSYSFPIEELLNTYIPQFTGILNSYWGRNGIHFHSEYLGASVLVLATLGFGAALGITRRGFARFWLGVFVVALLWALGGYTPFFQLLYALVPGTKFFRAPSTIFYVVALSIAVFTALGVERALALDFTKRFLVGWSIAAGILLLLGVSGGLTSMATAIALPQQADKVPGNAAELGLGSIRSFFAAAAMLAVLFLLLSEKVRAPQAAWAFVAIAALDLWSIERFYWLFSQPAAQIYASDAAIEYLQHVKEPGRVLALQLGQGDATRDPYLTTVSNGLMIHGVRQLVGYHGNELGRYETLLGGPDYKELGNPKLWSLLNVQYILTDVDSLPIPDAKKLLGPVKNAVGDAEYLFQLPGDNAYAWVAPVIVKAGDAPVLATVLDPRFDAPRVALVDSAAPVLGPQITTMPAATGIGVHTVSYAPGDVVLELAKPAPAGAALVVSENYYPGWVATVDGKTAPVVRTDYSLIGVVMPTGGTKVELTFTSPSYQKGKMLTLVALGLSLVGIVAGAAADRRRRG